MHPLHRFSPAALLLSFATALLLADSAGQAGPALQTTMAAPAAGTARIVVMRPENGFMGAGDRAFAVKIDGRPMPDLMTGSFVFVDRPAGRHVVEADLWDIPGVTRYQVNAVSGRTYYVVAKLNKGVNKTTLGALGGGLLGKYIVASAAGLGGEHGAIDLNPVGEATAKQIIAKLKPAR